MFQIVDDLMFNVSAILHRGPLAVILPGNSNFSFCHSWGGFRDRVTERLAKGVDQPNASGPKVAQNSRYDCKPVLKLRDVRQQVGVQITCSGGMHIGFDEIYQNSTILGAVPSDAKSSPP